MTEQSKDLPQGPVSMELAGQAIEQWLHFKRIGAFKRQRHHDAIQVIQEAIASGILEVLGTFQIRHTLLFPVRSPKHGTEITEFIYRPLLTLEALKKRFGTTARALDTHTMVAMYASALTGRSVPEVDQVDTADKEIIQAIVCFYL